MGRLSGAMTLGVCMAAGLTMAGTVRAQEPTEDDMAKARNAYSEAEAHAAAEEWQEAADKYEQAYHLVPGKHGFAYKVGYAAYNADDCARADEYLSHFNTYGDRSKHPEYFTETDRILNDIEVKGCAEPPPVDPAELEASKKGCRIDASGGLGEGVADGWWLLTLPLLAARRRFARR